MVGNIGDTKKFTLNFSDWWPPDEYASYSFVNMIFFVLQNHEAFSLWVSLRVRERYRESFVQVGKVPITRPAKKGWNYILYARNGGTGQSPPPSSKIIKNKFIGHSHIFSPVPPIEFLQQNAVFQNQIRWRWRVFIQRKLLSCVKLCCNVCMQNAICLFISLYSRPMSVAG